MDSNTLLYIFIGLTLVFLLAFFVSLRALSNQKSMSNQKRPMFSDNTFEIDHINSSFFLNNLILLQKVFIDLEFKSTKTSKLGHDINGALQVMMFSSSRMKKVTNIDDLTPLLIKFDDSIVKIRDLILANKESSNIAITQIESFDLYLHLNEIIKNFEKISTVNNVSFKVINESESESLSVSMNQYNRFVLSALFDEILKDFALYSSPNLTLPINIRFLTNKKIIQFNLNLESDNDSIFSKYSNIKNNLSDNFISLNVVKIYEKSLKLSISLAEH